LDQGFIDILKKLVDEQGNNVLTDAKKCKSFLSDYTKNEYKKESRLLVQAVEIGVTKAIDKTEELELCKKAQIRDMEEELGLNSAVAADIANALALVLRGDTTITVSASAENAAVNSVPPEGQTEDTHMLIKKGQDAYDREDYEEAFKYWSKAAEQGDADAQLRLGFNCYTKGQGVSEDAMKAAYWYEKAADQGHADAQWILGHCCFKGIGVPQDYIKAAKWFGKAAEQGNAIAQFDLGYCYDKGEGVSQDKAKAIYWYEKAAEQGHTDAQFILGICYNKGEDVLQDKTKAVYWFTKAAEQGHTDAQFILGICYSEGEGVSQNYVKAVKWFRKAAKQGNADAQFKLGYCYENGIGVPQDYAKAEELFKKAIAAGCEDAKPNLAKLREMLGSGSSSSSSKSSSSSSKSKDNSNERVTAAEAIIQFFENIGFEDIKHPRFRLSFPLSVFLSLVTTGCITFLAKSFIPGAWKIVGIVSLVPSFMAFYFTHKVLRVILIMIAAIGLVFGVYSYVSPLKAKLNAAVTKTETATETTTVTTTVTSDVNFRAEPSIEAVIIKTLSQGDTVMVTGEVSGGWTQVSHNGDTGWVSSEYLNK
jgi:TPR repeat protein